MEKLYEASQDFSEVPKGTYVGDGAYGHDFIFSYLKSFKDRQKTSFGFTPWADESTKRMMKGNAHFSFFLFDSCNQMFIVLVNFREK